MEKCTLLIVEDEPLVRKGIISIIQSLSDKIGVIEEATTGIDAVEIAKKLSPDIIIMDIKLPEMDGIKASSLIKRISPKVKIIILTAYPEFEYAKEAIKLNVSDYILKPIDEKSLKDLINRLILDISEERKSESEKETMRTRLEQILPYTKMRLAYDLILNDIEDTGKIQQLLRSIGIYFLPSTVLVVSIIDSKKLSSAEVYSSLLLKEEMYRILQDKLEGKYKSFVVPFRFNEFVIFYSPESTINEEIKSTALSLGRYICREISCKLRSVQICVGIGRNYNDIYYLYRSYLEAIAAISQRDIKGDEVIHIDDVEEIKDWQILCLSREKGVQEYIIKKEKIQAITAIQNLLGEVYKNLNNNLTITKSVALYIMIDNFRVVTKLGGKLERLMSLQARYINGLIELSSFSDIVTWTSLVIEELVDLWANTSNKGEILEKAIQFINEHYADDISLKEISNYLFISPYYLSHIFKKMTKKTITEYITSIRLEKAKELLTATDLPISQISTMTGYKDINYFSKVFKKQLGITPSEYRSSYSKGLRDVKGYK